MPTVSIQIKISDSHREETDRLTRQLRQQLLALDVDDVALGRDGQPPAGAKGDAITVGTLVVSLANSAGLAAICQVIRTWVTRDRGRRVIIKDGKRTLDITGTNPAQQQQIIDAFLSHSPEEDDTGTSP
jgi:hypothetical protein